jgi:hypothetical protein
VDRAPLARKDPAIAELVDRLEADLGTGFFELADHWEDLMAIGFARPGDPDVLVYVAVLIDDEGDVLDTPNRFFYECESPSDTDELGYDVAASAERVPYDEVLKAVSRHLAAR